MHCYQIAAGMILRAAFRLSSTRKVGYTLLLAYNSDAFVWLLPATNRG